MLFLSTSLTDQSSALKLALWNENGKWMMGWNESGT
jgi:hypothetical protein